MKLLKSYNGKTIYILGDPYKIVEQDLQEEEELGNIDHTNMLITIEQNMPPEQKLKVLCHEIGHVFYSKNYLLFGKRMNDQKDEFFSQLFEDFFFRLLVDNDFSKLKERKVYEDEEQPQGMDQERSKGTEEDVVRRENP